MEKILILTLTALIHPWASFGDVGIEPEQVHLSLGATPREMIVTWVTMQQTNQSVVEYGLNGLELVANGTETKYIDKGSEHRVLFIHRVIMTDLIPGGTYVYHCGSDDGWSDVFYFTAIKDGSDWSPRFAIYGDMGSVNGQSIPRLQQEAQRRNIDAILHVGDFAYDMDNDNSRVGDTFMRQIQPIAAYMPYMTCVGNHEWRHNFSNYVNRFTMVNSLTGEMNNHFFSFNIGPAHIISFSTEFYFYLFYGWNQIGRQFHWLEADLIEANKPENRKLRPWIITMAHRPMYCSSTDGDDCTHNESIIRKGIPIIHKYGLEDLFYKYGVDLEIWAHEHFYERMYPIYDRKVYNGSQEEPYRNPKAPVHIITGSAGCKERFDPISKKPAAWSAVRLADYGYTRMQIINSTHLSMEQVSDDQNGLVVDKILLIKDNHGPYIDN